MESARKILEQYADIVIFVLGVLWVFAIFMRVSQIQTLQMEDVSGGRNALTYIDTAQNSEIRGSSLISFLLGDDVVPVRYNGTTYNSFNKEVLVEKIDVQASYRVLRVYKDTDFPTMIEIVKIVEGE